MYLISGSIVVRWTGFALRTLVRPTSIALGYSGRFWGVVDSLICLDKVFGMVLLVRLLRERGLLGGAYVLASWLIEPKTPWIILMSLT